MFGVNMKKIFDKATNQTKPSQLFSQLFPNQKRKAKTLIIMEADLLIEGVGDTYTSPYKGRKHGAMLSHNFKDSMMWKGLIIPEMVVDICDRFLEATRWAPTSYK